MTTHTGRHFLQIPGPTNVPERVLRAIDSATIDHRGPEFQKLGQEVLAGLKHVFKTRSPVVICGCIWLEAGAIGSACWVAQLRSPPSSPSSSSSVRSSPIPPPCSASAGKSRPSSLISSSESPRSVSEKGLSSYVSSGLSSIGSGLVGGASVAVVSSDAVRSI